MNLQEFTSPLPKPWLNIKCNDIEAETLDVGTVVIDSLELKNLLLVQQPSVPNPSVGNSAVYCTAAGLLHTNDSTGNVISYCANPAQADQDMNDFNISNVGHILPQVTGAADLGSPTHQFRSIELSGSVTGATNTRSADDIVSCTGASVNQRVAVFSGTSGKVITDGGALLSAYLPLAGGTMSGNIAMGGNEVTGFGALRPTATNIIIGPSASSSANTNNVVIGNAASSTVGGNNIVMGVNSGGSATSCIAIGNTAVSSANGAIAIGSTITNSTSDSVMIGNTTCVNWRSAGNNVCDLGTAALRFKDAHLAGSLVGSTKTTAVNDICSNSGGAVTSGQVATFSGTGGRLLTNSGTPVLGAASATSLSFSSTSGIIGTTTNDSAAAGSVGEYISASLASGSAVALTSGIGNTITSISLTAGDWDVNGTVCFAASGGAVVNFMGAGINTVAATLPTAPGTGALARLDLTMSANAAPHLPTGTTRYSLSGTTTIYLTCNSGFAPGSVGAYGFLRARRVR